MLTDDAKNKNSDPTTPNPMFLNTKNLTSKHSYNLKSNVFDQMLSDEMLSMKQRLFEKDLAYTSNVQTATKSNVATPTLEVKQKWPVVNLFTRPQDTDDLDDYDATETENHEINVKSYCNSNEPKIKSLDVRSLSGHSQNSMHNPEIKCNCANEKANGNHHCKRGDDCTRKVPHGSGLVVGNSPYPAFYMPYQAYFVSDNNDLKPTKRRKPSKPQDGDLYYEDDWKKKRPPKDDDEIIMNIDYDVEDTKKSEFPLNCIHEDLKEVYNKGVKRKCYCSSSQIMRSHRNVLFILCLTGCFGSNLLLLKYKVLF